MASARGAPISMLDRFEALERRVGRLAAAVRGLRQGRAESEAEDIRQALRRRGLAAKRALHEQTLVPRSAAARQEFYRLLRHYSFRLFLRDVIKRADGFGVDDLTRYCSPAVARRYLRWLVERGVAQPRGRRYRLGAPVRSFGPTLEWFVAQVLRHEFGIPSAWNLRVERAGRGGDYDVGGFQEGACVYIETKSSPPRNIEGRQVRAFFDRLHTLHPQLAVFLNDTQLRMGDKIA